VLLTAFDTANGHGALTTPAPRNPNNAYIEGPVTTSDPDIDDFVCRFDGPLTPATTLTAGGTLDMRWDFGAAHVGDCAVFMSYDINAARSSMEWFKIANLPDCNVNNAETVTINLPSWLPAGQAVLRWDWYALHVVPTVEFYVHCVDVTVTAGNSPISINNIDTFVIAGQYPASEDQDAGKYWDPYTNTIWKMEGPACVCGVTGNCCDTAGYDRSGFGFCADSGSTPSCGSSTPTDPEDEPVTECTDEVTYTVVSGDTLTSIAATYETTAEFLCELNALADCDALEVGQVLIIEEEMCLVDHASTVALSMSLAVMFITLN
jgi:hypothetical protein